MIKLTFEFETMEQFFAFMQRVNRAKNDGLVTKSPVVDPLLPEINDLTRPTGPVMPKLKQEVVEKRSKVKKPEIPGFNPEKFAENLDKIEKEEIAKVKASEEADAVANEKQDESQIPQRICPICGGPVTGHGRKKVCSPECKAEYRRRYRNELNAKARQRR